VFIAALISTMEGVRKTGYLFHEIYTWHNPGFIQSLKKGIEPARHWESADTKRRVHSLIAVSGLLESLHQLQPRRATPEEIMSVHSESYFNRVRDLSADYSKGHHVLGDSTTFSPGGYEVAVMSAGGAIVAMEAVLSGQVQNAYALIRPPGHHAEVGEGAGFCVFNNIAIAARAALSPKHNLKRVAVVDWDVHHGNGTQHIFEEDPRMLFVSVHQDCNYPLDSGHVTETGKGAGEGFTINVPLPPGSGRGAFRAAFERVVLPALRAFQPELILVSCGFDASYMDNLGAMILGSDDFRWMAAQVMTVADEVCGGRLVMLHEGGYSEHYVPFCGLAVVEELCGVLSSVKDPWMREVEGWGYQALQTHQDEAVKRAEAALQLLKSKV
jgi:acetoin utilization deacetylase AcuC-like enzyme